MTSAARTLVIRKTTPHRGIRDAAWPCTPVAHLAYETDNHFTTIHCSTR